jgi:hypothetical protein
MSKYIDIRDAGTSASGITRIWEVRNTRTGEVLGQIKWRGANGWRGYAFFVEVAGYDWIAFDRHCLRKIADFLDEKNAERKLAKNNRERDRGEGKDQDA